MKLKNAFSIFIAVFISLSLINIKIFARSNEITNIDILVELDEYGNAKITETWKGSFPNGTENYIVMNNLLGANLNNFRVSSPMTNEEFTEVTPWKVNKSRKEKAYKYGIVTKKDSYELCWGTYGFEDESTFIIEYNLDNFVKKYQDGYTGFNWQFIASDMSPSPKNISIKIQRDGGFQINDTNIWGFGFDGQMSIENNVIVAKTTGSFYRHSYMTILVQTPNDYFSINSTYPQTFQSVKNIALDNSEYLDVEVDGRQMTKKDIPEVIGFAIFSFIFTLLPLFLPGAFILYVIFVLGKKYRVKNMPKINDKNIIYTGEIPFENNLEIGFFVNQVNTVGSIPYQDLLSAYLLKWVKFGYLEQITNPFENNDGFRFCINYIPQPSSATEQSLFKLIKTVADSENILYDSDFNKWTNYNSNYIVATLSTVMDEAQTKFKENGYLTIQNSIFTKRYLTPYGKVEVEKFLGFKKYLVNRNYIDIDSQNDVDMSIYEDYLIWSTLLGVNNYFSEQFYINDPIYTRHNRLHRNWRRINHMTKNINTYTTSSRSHSRSSGRGGRSSRSGGRGSGGGGRGGGSR